MQKKTALIEAVDSLKIAVEMALKKNNKHETIEETFLEDCQTLAVAIGEALETRNENVVEIVHLLEECCEGFYNILENNDDFEKNIHLIDSLLSDVQLIKDKINITLSDDKKEIVFLPYKSSMWDSMETIWIQAKNDPEVDVSVIPIPYFSKNKDGSLKEWHYEGEDFPKYVPIVDYKTYDIEWNRPDVIFIHNPYDEYNYVTSVHPHYYSSRLKSYTKCLVYVPYFLFPGVPEEHFVMTAGVINADLVFVQNQRVRKFYIETLCKKMGENTDILENKIVALGSPKTDKLLNTKLKDINIPDDWKKMISDKKVVFFNTNISMLLKNKEYIIENLRRIFDIIRKHPKCTVIWREHPLSMSTIDTMIPEIKEDYLMLKRQFVEEKWGILDLNSDPYMAMIVSDCYFGAGGSLAAIYPISGKPIMRMGYYYPKGMSTEEITLTDLNNSRTKRMVYVETNIHSLELFIQNIDVLRLQSGEQIESQSMIADNLNGTVGSKIYSFIKSSL